MRKVSQPMQVWIYACRFANSPAYQESALSLSAHQEAVGDALQRTRLMEGEPYRLERGRDWPGFIESVPSRYNHTLEGLNLLVYKLMQATEKQIEVYEDVLRALPERNMKQVINGLCNLGRFEFLPRIRCSNDVGKMTIDNDLDPILKDLPGDIYPLLNTEKIRAYTREKEGGVFTSRGYCYRASDQWQEAYNGKQLPKQVRHHPSQFPLYLVPRGTEPENLNIGTWLGIPYDETPKSRVLENLGLESFKQRRIAKVYTATSLFEQLAQQDHSVGRWNEFARRPSSMTEKELLEYKVAVEYEGYSSLEQAARLADRSGECAFDPVQVTYAIYGRECLGQMGADLEVQAFRRFGFESYGKGLYIQARRKLTAYEAVSKESGLEETQIRDHSMVARGIGWRR